MSDDPTQTAADRQRISLSQGYEIRDGTQSLGCTEEALRQAVKGVGSSADAVRTYLRGKSR